MATVFYQGLDDDKAAGNLATGVDLRCMAVMSNTTIDTEEDAQTLSDFTTIDEADGVGYAQADLASVTVTYDSTNDRHRVVDADDFDLDGGTDSVAVCSRDVTRLLYYRYVDGTDANDVPWLSIDIGPYTPQGSSFDVVVNTTGIYYEE